MTELYNAKRTGRGIFFDGSRIADGQVTISYNIPTTKTEIHDFIQVAKEIERQFKKASFYCTEENRNYTMDELENKEEAMAAFSLESLHRFCNDQEMKQCILTLALYPWFMEPEKREYYKTCPDLDDFEETIPEYMMNHGAMKFDASHMRIPGNVTKEEIDKMIAGMGQE